MMRHCRHRRADAVGLLGDDRSSEFTIEKVMAMDVQYDFETRKAYQAKIEDEPAARITTRQGELADPARQARRRRSSVWPRSQPKARAELAQRLSPHSVTSLNREPERHARYEVAIRLADDESACLIADEDNMLQKSTSARVSVLPAGSRGGGA